MMKSKKIKNYTNEFESHGVEVKSLRDVIQNIVLYTMVVSAATIVLLLFSLLYVGKASSGLLLPFTVTATSIWVLTSLYIIIDGVTRKGPITKLPGIIFWM